MTIPLANTRAKLPRSIALKASTDLLNIDFTTAQTSDIVSQLSGKSITIGAVERISIDQTVELKEWREFDPDQGGQIVEWAPGKEDAGYRGRRRRSISGRSIYGLLRRRSGLIGVAYL